MEQEYQKHFQSSALGKQIIEEDKQWYLRKELNNALDSVDLPRIQRISSQMTSAIDTQSIDLAIHQRDLSLIGLLFQMNPKKYFCDDVLIKIIYKGTIEVLQLWKKNGGKFRTRLLSPLAIAVRAEKLEIVKYFLDQGEEIDQFALVASTRITNVEVIKLLLDRGNCLQQLIAPSEFGQLNDINPLIDARNLDMIKLFVEIGCPITDDILEYSIKYKDPEIIQFLLQKAKSPNLDKLFEKCIRRPHVLLLLEYVSDFSEEQAGYLIEHAVKAKNLDLIRTCLRKGALLMDSNIVEHLYLKGDTEMIQFLIDNKVCAFNKF